MSLPGLPPPRRTVLPVPPDGAERARAAGRRRRGSALAATTVVGAVALGAAALLPAERPRESLQVAAPDPGGGPPGRVSGTVTGPDGRPLARVAVLPVDLSRVLTRTDEQGRYAVPCGTDLLLAGYAPSALDEPVRERSPGAVDAAWRQVRARDRCGERVDVVLPPGGAVEGRGRPGEDLLLRRAVGATSQVLARGPVFATRVRPDGSWRVEGLDTGRYLLPDGTPVDVRQGATTRSP